LNLAPQVLQREGAKTGFPAETLEKSIRLVSLLNALRSHPFLKTRIALKAGRRSTFSSSTCRACRSMST